MAILSAQTIRQISKIDPEFLRPFCERSQDEVSGLSYGLSSCGYDVRLDQAVHIYSGGFAIASTMERFILPNWLVMRVLDKSSWARRGLFVQNTIAEPGWCGYLTLELTNDSDDRYVIRAGTPIAQVIFEQLDQPTEQPYSGKYQNQPRGPVRSIDNMR